VTALLEVEDLVKHFVAARSVFGRPTAFVKAVDGVSFQRRCRQDAGAGR
jgi:peptide/nickel transport system ATP-binding protein/oligopeptide transport system ATP-binding protein